MTPSVYSLPATDIPQDVLSILDPWIGGFIGLSLTEATERLRSRWATIARPSLISLRDTLSEFEVRAIVLHQGRAMIYAERPNSDQNVIGNAFYLPAPIETDELISLLKTVHLSDNEAVLEFMKYFAGLAESVSYAGNFVHRDSPWPTFTDSWNGSIQGFDEWKGSLMLYRALNGCYVLVQPNGKVGWWLMQERLVGSQAQNFDEFLIQFNEHRKLAWPFDPYGIPAKRRKAR